MRKLFLFVCGLALSGPAIAKDVYVRGHVRADGTYVQPHMRTAPNSTKTDNWSTRGNVNPYTGQRGTENPYPEPRRSYLQPAPYPSNHSSDDNEPE